MVLEEKWQKYLENQPSEVMGYQRVDVILNDDLEIDGLIVLNGREILGVPFTSENIKELKISE